MARALQCIVAWRMGYDRHYQWHFVVGYSVSSSRNPWHVMTKSIEIYILGFLLHGSLIGIILCSLLLIWILLGGTL
jgi:hypothetical protein